VEPRRSDAYVERSAIPAPPSLPPPPPRPPRPSSPAIVRGLVLGLLALGALPLLVAAIALPAYARNKTRELLQTSKDISGDFLDVQTNLFPLRYSVRHLKVRKKDAVLKDPIFYADRLDIHLRWGPLLAGRSVATVDGQRAK